jgi:hypothetical protein
LNNAWNCMARDPNPWPTWWPRVVVAVATTSTTLVAVAEAAATVVVEVEAA